MDKFLEVVELVNNYINNIVWGPIMLIFFLFIGFMFTIRLGWFQILHIGLCFKTTIATLFNKNKDNEGDSKSISSFQAMTTALAGAIGTGNIVGVATAITLGGPGSIFWMWIASFFGMMTIFAENVLGIKYRQKNKNGEWVGGPMYYMEKGLKNKFMATVFSIFCIMATLGMGNMAQANSIAGAMSESFFIDKRFTGLVLAILVGVIIFGGTQKIASFSEKIVPFMALFYITGGLVVIVYNHKLLPTVINDIFRGAFNFKSIFGGACGYTFFMSIKYGIARGVFSNEAGLGSSPIIYAAADTNEPVVQGMWGIFQVFFDTMVGCTITALCILLSGAVHYGYTGIALSVSAFENVFGIYGNIFVSISIIMFAFATIVGWSYYGEKSLEYLAGTRYTLIYKAFYTVIVAFACVMDINFVWSISDTFNGLMAIPNLIALLLLSKEVVNETNKYKSKLEIK